MNPRGRVAVAISTTGHEHRLGFLETCVAAWDAALGEGDSLFVTVDGSHTDAYRVADRLSHYTGSVFQVGQRVPGTDASRMGVAVNKNTGLELMMDNTKAEHLFLCDDDTWPLYAASLDKHINFDQRHSLVCWGKSRLDHATDGYALWNHPRGVMLYQHRWVVENVGGMDERFGLGGHEHVEYSQRIFHTGITSAPFVSPASYATRGAMGARILWHAEDMPRVGELGGDWTSRKRRNTTINPSERNWVEINKIMDERRGSKGFVGYRAHENGRASATLFNNLMGQGAGGDA